MCLPGQPPAAPAHAPPAAPAPSAPSPPVPPAGPAPPVPSAACAPPPAAPASAAEAVAMARAGLAWLARADAAGLTAAEQGDCLRALEAAEAAHTAARARVLAAFHAGNGCQDDGHGSAKSWLRWQTRITTNAAATAMAWMRRLGAHPAVAGALAAGEPVAVVGPGGVRVDGPAARRSTGRARTRSCWPPPPAARTWPAWRSWPRKYGGGRRGRTPTGMTGSRTGRSAWT